MELLVYDLVKTILTIGLLFLSCFILLRVYMNRPKQPSGNPVVVEEQKIILPFGRGNEHQSGEYKQKQYFVLHITCLLCPV